MKTTNKKMLVCLSNFSLRTIAITLTIHLIFTPPAGARPISLEEAMNKAQHFLYSHSQDSALQARGIAPMFELAYEAQTRDNATSCFYVLNKTSSSGYIIVSADNRLPDVLGYSDNGDFDINNIPDNMRWWLSEYERQIERILSSTDDILPSTEFREGWTEIQPMIKTHWHQGAPFNNLCPMKKTGTRSAAGCVSIAMAQIMNYYQWPVTGRGSNSYEWNDEILSMDFSEVTFDWANMLDTYSSQNDAPEEQNAVATLIYACGISTNTEYDAPSGSPSSIFNTYNAWLKYFDYDAKYLSRRNSELSDWEALIYSELTNGRPVLYRGNRSVIGHAFVCDGYSYDGLFHINWGWGDGRDGYFLLSVVDPFGEGDGYTENQAIVYGIRPVQKAKINGVYYSLVEESREAIVCPPEEGYYTGDFIIPQTTAYAGNTYTVTEIKDSVWKYCQDLTSLVVYPPIDEFTSRYWKPEMSPNLQTVKLANVKHIGGWAFDKCTNLTTLELGNSLETIGKSAFRYCQALTELTIPDNVKSIGGWAFYNCNALKTLKLSANLESIDSCTFYNCYALKELTIPDNVKSINGWAFYNCNALTTLQLGTGLNSIGTSAFNKCFALTELTIPDKVKSIGGWAFYNCNALKTLKLSASLESIDSCTFYNCYALEKLTIPDKVEHIGTNAFRECNTLTELTIPDNVKSIGYRAFYDCNALTTLQLGTGLNSIGKSAFYKCFALTELTIPDKVKSIGGWAFYNCNALKTLKLSANLESIDSCTFYNCYALEKLTIPDKVEHIGTSAFRECNTLTTLQLGAGLDSIGRSAFYRCYALAELILPDNLKSIGDYAFCACNTLKELTIPDKVTSVGNYAFYQCTNLATLNLGNELESIGDFAFYRCNALTDLTLPNKVKTIGEEAFCYGPYIERIVIPNSIERIGSKAFYDTGTYCTRTIVSQIQEPFDLLENPFSDKAFNRDVLCVPFGTIEKYKTREIWKNFANITDNEFSGISSPTTNFDVTNQDHYSISGQHSTTTTSGIIIVKMSDGTVKKVMKK